MKAEHSAALDRPWEATSACPQESLPDFWEGEKQPRVMVLSQVQLDKDRETLRLHSLLSPWQQGLILGKETKPLRI